MPRVVRVPLFVILLALGALAVAACSSADSPGWTYSPETPPPVASTAPSPDASGSAAPSTAPSAAPSESHDAGGGGGDLEVITLTAQNIQWVEKELSAPADVEFIIRLDNQDANVPHNVEIKQDGKTVFKGDIFNGVATLDNKVEPPLAAGTYQYICTVHPNMVGTLTVGG